MKNRTKGELDCFTVSCRQMAYERGMQDILDIIDELNNNTWSFIKKPRREKRCKRPLQDKLKERFEQEEAERKQRGETEAHLRQRMGKEEYADVVTQGAAAVTSRTSFGSSCAFGDLTSIRSQLYTSVSWRSSKIHYLCNISFMLFWLLDIRRCRPYLNKKKLNKTRNAWGGGGEDGGPDPPPPPIFFKKTRFTLSKFSVSFPHPGPWVGPKPIVPSFPCAPLPPLFRSVQRHWLTWIMFRFLKKNSGDRKSRKSTGGRNTSEPTLTNGIEAAQDRSTQNPRDNNNAANQSGASPLGEDEPGDGLPFYIPLGPTHTFSYPAEEPARSENPHRYRLNRTFVSRKQTNAQKSHQSTIILSSAFRECWTFGNQRPESQSWASRVSDSKRDPGVARSNSSPICARIISPWRENDCRGLTNLQGRTRSAPGSPETSLLTKRRDGNHRSFFPTLQSRQMVGLPKKDNYMVAKKPRAIASVRNDSIVLSRSSSVMRHVIAHNNRITDLSCTTVRGKQVSSKQVEGSIRLPGSALANEKIDQRELKSLNPESEKDVPHIMVVPPT